MSTGPNRYSRLTMAQALVTHLVAQRIDHRRRGAASVRRRLCHLRPRQRHLPGRGPRRGARPSADLAGAERAVDGLCRGSLMPRHIGADRICVATSSIGPGATNMVTAAAVAHTNRLPVLFLSGDIFHHRLPHPVLQQVEHFDDPTLSVNDAFRPVTRYWDRITHPAQLIHSLPRRDRHHARSG